MTPYLVVMIHPNASNKYIPLKMTTVDASEIRKLPPVDGMLSWSDISLVFTRILSGKITWTLKILKWWFGTGISFQLWWFLVSMLVFGVVFENTLPETNSEFATEKWSLGNKPFLLVHFELF